MSGVITKPLGVITNYLFRTSMFVIFGLIVSWVALRLISPTTEYRLFQAVIGSIAGVLTYDFISYLLCYFESKYNKG